MKEGQPVAYGHLDREGEVVWLGTAVIEEERGKGAGKQMMEALMAAAREKKLSSVRLSVDNDNQAAISLYRRFGFRLLSREEKHSFFQKNFGPRIFISSLAWAGKDLEEMVRESSGLNLPIEFSSGMPYVHDMESKFLSVTSPKLLHNYFPAPSDPFVLNLASGNDATRKRSVDHCKNGLRLASICGAPFFSAHAGFCVDPSPSELGKELKKASTFDREKHWELFISSLSEVLKYADQYKVDFLIENNVLAKMNVYPDGTSPLFCSHPDEMTKLMRTLNHPRLGLLLDTGHLKVSAGTEGFDLNEAIHHIKSWVGCIHHSDNDGIFDSNRAIDGDYWFLKHMNDFREIHHVLEVKKQMSAEIKRQAELLNQNI